VTTKRKGKKIRGEILARRAFIAVGIITILLLSLYLIQVQIINNLASNASNNEVVLGTTSNIEEDSGGITFWKDYLSKYPKYFPGWLELSKLELEAGNTEGFIVAIYKAESLNPNSTEVEKLKFQYGLK
jgi:hypothetical protein